jgi:dihydroxy-acid dehydratase
MEGGPIALVEEGDLITIDIPGKDLTLKVDRDVLAERKKHWKQPPPRVTGGYLKLYSHLASSAATGAIITVDNLSSK